MLPEASVISKKLTLINEDSIIEGTIILTDIAHIHGVLKGEVKAKKGSMLILMNTAVVEGNIYADTLFIQGYVKGNIVADTRVVLGKTARVIGNIITASLCLDCGAYFDGQCSTVKSLL